MPSLAIVNHTLRLAIVTAALTVAVPSIAKPMSKRNLATEEANRALVVGFYNRFFNAHDVRAADVVADRYIQHNPNVPDGKAPFVDYFRGYFRDNPGARATIVRSATDGDLVFLHVRFSKGGEDRGQAVVDIFRVAKGKIVEHWDVIQDVPAATANPNGMF